MYQDEPYIDPQQAYYADYYDIYESPGVIAERYNKCESILRNFVEAYMLPDPLPIPAEEAVEFLTDLCRVMNIPYQRLSFKINTSKPETNL